MRLIHHLLTATFLLSRNAKTLEIGLIDDYKKSGEYSQHLDFIGRYFLHTYSSIVLPNNQNAVCIHPIIPKINESNNFSEMNDTERLDGIENLLQGLCLSNSSGEFKYCPGEVAFKIEKHSDSTRTKAQIVGLSEKFLHEKLSGMSDETISEYLLQHQFSQNHEAVVKLYKSVASSYGSLLVFKSYNSISKLDPSKRYYAVLKNEDNIITIHRIIASFKSGIVFLENTNKLANRLEHYVECTFREISPISEDFDFSSTTSSWKHHVLMLKNGGTFPLNSIIISRVSKIVIKEHNYKCSDCNSTDQEID